MTVFNPQVSPTNDPNYLNYSKPIGDVQADKSTGLLLSTLGEVLDSGVGLADRTIKEGISDQVRTGVEKQRDAYTQALVNVRDQQASGVIPTPESQAAAGIKVASIADGEGEDVPAGVKAGVERAQSIGNAMTQNGGKANDTLYTGALTSLAKNLRNQYPGYKDYIDHKISEVSGINPANAYMKNLLEDINKNSTGNKSEVDKAIALGRQYLGYDPNMPSYIEAVRQGLPNSIQNLEKRINNVAGTKVQFDELERQRKTQDWTKADDLEIQKDQFSRELRSKSNLAWQGVVEIPGLNSPQTIQKLLDDQRSGRVSLNDEQNAALLNAATLARDTWKRQAIDVANSRGYSKTIPNIKERNEIIENEGTFFNDQIEAIKHKDYGTLFGNQRYVTAATSDASKQLLDDGDMAGYWRTAAGVRQLGGDGWANFLQGEALKQGTATNLKNFMTKETLKMSTPYDPRYPQDTHSLYEAIQKAKDAKVSPKSKVYDSLVENVNVLAIDKPPEGVSQAQMQTAKKEIVNYMFDPAKNSKLMTQFSKDFTDSDGVFHKGKFAVYDTLTQPKIVDKIWDLKDSNAWEKMKNTQGVWFKTLFGEEMKNADDAMHTGQLDIKMNWNSDSGQMEAIFPKVHTGVEARYVDSVRESVRNLNKGLVNLKYIYDKEGTDTSAVLLDTLMQMGFSPNDRLQGDNLPQKVTEAIAASKKTNRIEDAFKAAR